MFAFKRDFVRTAVLALAAIGVLTLSGCGTAQQDFSFVPEFVPASDTAIAVGEVVDAAPKIKRGNEHKDLDVAQKMRDALETKLRASKLLGGAESGQKPLVLSARIVDYEPGDAFKRWLMPGFGSTVLTVECALYDGKKRVATVNARRTVDAGGAYTIGAWEAIFGHVADDIVNGLKEKLKTQT